LAERSRRAALDPRHRGLLDTTFLIDAERGRTTFDDLIADEDDVAIAAITLAELRVGAHLAGGHRAPARSAFVDAVAVGIPVLGYDASVAEDHVDLLAHARRQGRPRGAHDLIIAATARASGRVVVTADPAGFADLPGVAVRPHR
jgi:tRNA(fMet)-specific endonuclease VapC